MIFNAITTDYNKVYDFISSSKDFNLLDERKKNKFLISIEEIFVNIASYAYKDKDISENEKKVNISIFKEDGLIKVIFKDSGAFFNPLDRQDPDVTLAAKERNIGGLGIYLVKKNTDFAQYERKDNKNMFVIGMKI